MKKRIVAFVALMLACFAAQAAAQETMRVYAAQGALAAEEEWALEGLLDSAFPQADWEIVSGDLRALVMADRTPQLAICAPGEALPWAKEGLLLALDGCVPEIGRMQETVVDACVHEESLFMAPLRAQHRQMAVNPRLMREAHMDYMMNATEHPVWFPSELYQVMDALSMRDVVSFDLWRPEPQSAGALEGFVQSLYGGALLSADAELCTADSPAIEAGVSWLQDMLEAGLIGYAQDRQEALERFLAGETAIFLDWTRADAASCKAEFVPAVMSYPSSSGLPVRAFEVTGIAVFAHEAEDKELLALSAMAFLLGDEKAQAAIGERAIFEDGALWLPCLTAADAGATLRSRFCEALRAVFEEGADVEEELEAVTAAINTMMK